MRSLLLTALEQKINYLNPLLVPKTLPHELTGNRSSDQLLVFLHGYLDTTALWDGIVPNFER